MILSRIVDKFKRILNSIKVVCLIKSYNFKRLFFINRPFKKKIINSLSPVDFLKHNADKKRFVELLEMDYSLNKVIVTCYFTLKSDPQTGENRNKGEFKYIQPWYDSILNLGVDGIILHDGLEESFIQKYQTEKIQFRYCEMGNYSIFEERWFLYHLLICNLEKLKNVFLTDSNDVYIQANPFKQFSDQNKLYVGRDNANRIKDSGWLLEELEDYIRESNFKVPASYFYQNVYNAGVVGGSSKIIFFLTTKMLELMMQASSDKHKDMTILNLVIHKHFSPKLSVRNLERKIVNTLDDSEASNQNIISGFPFNSGFKDFDFDSKAVFIHK